MAALAQAAPKGKVWAYCATPGCEGRWVRPIDAARAERCQKCHCKAIAAKGYAATVAKYGEKFAVMHQRDYRLAHPSNLERMVAGWLDEWRVSYQREVVFEIGSVCFLIDFVIDGRIAIEVQGEWAHSWHQQRDERKLDHLINDSDYTPLVLAEVDIQNGSAKAQLACIIANLPNDRQ